MLALTFDDGYKDHYKYVFPTLVKEKIRGFFYPPVNIFKGDVLNVNKPFVSFASTIKLIVCIVLSAPWLNWSEFVGIKVLL